MIINPQCVQHFQQLMGHQNITDTQLTVPSSLPSGAPSVQASSQWAGRMVDRWGWYAPPPWRNKHHMKQTNKWRNNVQMLGFRWRNKDQSNTAYLITICVCNLVRTLMQGSGSRCIIHIEMDPVVVNMVLDRSRREGIKIHTHKDNVHKQLKKIQHSKVSIESGRVFLFGRQGKKTPQSL